MRLPFVRGSIALAAMLAASRLTAQTGTGAIAGTVNGPNNRPLSGVVVQVADVRLGNYTNEDGRYTIDRVPAGSHRLIARLPGFVSDTVSVTVAADQRVTQDFTLKPTSVTLQTVTISSPRLNETKAAALQAQKTADNIVSVLSGDEIRSLPNANAAEAAARMPGVTSERDEGEGKFVEIRGTPPQFQNVEIDGVHIPGTLNGDRSVKLDDVPSDLLGAIEVSKTLTADMDASAIGGTVNLESKIPEGAPRGYVSAQYAYQTVENNSQGQGSFTFGGRVGEGNKLGFLLGASYDRTNRVIEDVEPFYLADNVQGGVATAVNNGGGYNHTWAQSWSEREYNYYRTRYGFDMDLDYRATPSSTFYLRGLYSAFFDQANRWVTSVNGGNDSLPSQSIADQASLSTEISNRGPVEHTWGFVGGGKHVIGIAHVDYSANVSGSSATTHDHYDDDYNGINSIGNFAYNYGASTNLVPQYGVSPALRTAIATGSNYQFSRVRVGNEAIDGENFGGQTNMLLPYSLGNLPASTKFGVKFTDEHKGDTPNNGSYAFNGANIPTLANFPGSYNVNNFYGHICGGCYVQAPFGSLPAVQNAIHGNANYAYTPDTYNNLTGTFAGTEQVLAAYVMQTVDVGDLHINAGLRAENTELGYRAFIQTDTSTANDPTLLRAIHRSHSYTDLFPSVQLRYALDENTNVRASFTRGIARPNYGDLAPSFSANGALANQFGSPIGAGNPTLKPEHAWNTDLLAEHYFPSVGVLSGGLFYKDISDFIFTRRVTYTGQVVFEQQYLPHGPGGDSVFFFSQKQNGPHAWLYGFEADYTQHLTFLPGALRGIGFDVNWTWVESRATVPQDTTIYHGNPFRHGMIPRQFPNMFNTSLLYDYSAVSARLTGQYTAASVYGYGADGSSNPNSGDNWNFPHWQIDGSAVVTIYGSTALQGQVLNLNNAVFGFFNGTSGHRFNVQREYYGTTLYIGVRQGLF